VKLVSCSNCGSGALTEYLGFAICEYCDSRFLLQSEDLPILESNISIQSDVADLLERCQFEPERELYYANLILDLDPHNKTALGIVSRDGNKGRKWN
jgi:hypothetical protein